MHGHHARWLSPAIRPLGATREAARLHRAAPLWGTLRSTQWGSRSSAGRGIRRVGPCSICASSHRRTTALGASRAGIRTLRNMRRGIGSRTTPSGVLDRWSSQELRPPASRRGLERRRVTDSEHASTTTRHRAVGSVTSGLSGSRTHGCRGSRASPSRTAIRVTKGCGPLPAWGIRPLTRGVAAREYLPNTRTYSVRYWPVGSLPPDS